jgi:hypothetical protein
MVAVSQVMSELEVLKYDPDTGVPPNEYVPGARLTVLK